MQLRVVLLLLSACGGAVNKPVPVTAAPTPTVPRPIVVTAAPTQTPAPFRGSFEVVRASDGNSTVVFADVFRRGALDGQMLWTIDGDAFSVEMWQITQPRPAEGGDLYALCRARATITARWQGNAVVLPSALRAKGWSTSLLFSKKTTGKTSTKRKSVRLRQRDGSSAMTPTAMPQMPTPSFTRSQTRGCAIPTSHGTMPAA